MVQSLKQEINEINVNMIKISNKVNELQEEMFENKCSKIFTLASGQPTHRAVDVG